jgi:hypothetical protein
MSFRGLDKFGKSSPQADKIAKFILARFNNDLSAANKVWKQTVLRCLWTKEIWGDWDQAERAAYDFILRTISTEDELKTAEIDLSGR